MTPAVLYSKVRSSETEIEGFSYFSKVSSLGTVDKNITS